MYNLLSDLTVGSILLLAFLVLTAKRLANAKANRWLGFFLLTLTIFMLDDSLTVHGVYKEYPMLIGVPFTFIFTLSPTLYLVVSRYVAIEKRFQWKHCLHFIPAFLFFLLFIPFFLSNDSIKLASIAEAPEKLNTESVILLSCWMVQLSSYWMLSLVKLRKHRKKMELLTASPAEFQLDWLRNFLYGIGGIVFVLLLDLVFNASFSPKGSWVDICYFVIVYFLGYFVIQQREVFPFPVAELPDINKVLEENELNSSDSKKKLVTDEALSELKEKLIIVLEKEKSYLNPELNLSMLARQMQLGTHEMSYVLNEGFQENFYQFINRYRIEESKRLLSSPDFSHLNMLGIAFESGFNSKTAFNTSFKKQVGISPSEYQKSCRGENNP